MPHAVHVILLPDMVEKLQPIAEARNLTVTDLVVEKVHLMIRIADRERQISECKEKLDDDLRSFFYAFCGMMSMFFCFSFLPEMFPFWFKWIVLCIWYIGVICFFRFKEQIKDSVFKQTFRYKFEI